MSAPSAGAPAGARLPDATRLGAVRLQVTDLTRSIAYYRDVLGFRVHESTSDSATFVTQDDDTILIELQEAPNAVPLPRGGRLGLFHFAILLPDRASLGRFVIHLANIGVAAGSADHLVSEALYLRDPDGLGIEVYADRPRSEWRSRAGELIMATEPLDLADLVKAAGGKRWTGMPAGTAVGHVHLHVGNLEEAAAFFHAALGLDKTVWSYPGALFLSAGGYHHHLGVNTWAGPHATRPRDDEARLLEWRIIVPSPEDADAIARRLETAGYPVTRTDRNWIAVDPWGTAFTVSNTQN